MKIIKNLGVLFMLTVGGDVYAAAEIATFEKEPVPPHSLRVKSALSRAVEDHPPVRPTESRKANPVYFAVFPRIDEQKDYTDFTTFVRGIRMEQARLIRSWNRANGIG
jgi:hypothetical protein